MKIRVILLFLGFFLSENVSAAAAAAWAPSAVEARNTARRAAAAAAASALAAEPAREGFAPKNLVALSVDEQNGELRAAIAAVYGDGEEMKPKKEAFTILTAALRIKEAMPAYINETILRHTYINRLVTILLMYPVEGFRDMILSISQSIVNSRSPFGFSFNKHALSHIRNHASALSFPNHEWEYGFFNKVIEQVERKYHTAYGTSEDMYFSVLQFLANRAFHPDRRLFIIPYMFETRFGRGVSSHGILDQTFKSFFASNPEFRR